MGGIERAVFFFLIGGKKEKLCGGKGSEWVGGCICFLPPRVALFGLWGNRPRPRRDHTTRPCAHKSTHPQPHIKHDSAPQIGQGTLCEGRDELRGAVGGEAVAVEVEGGEGRRTGRARASSCVVAFLWVGGVGWVEGVRMSVYLPVWLSN